MSRFYTGAMQIEAWLDKPKVERFMDAATLWYIALAGVIGGLGLLACAAALVTVVVRAL